MDTVVLDGVQYVKASVAAKQFRYTSDYVGQLCRNKKVAARLVGRTWFVNVESLQQHKRTRHQKKTSLRSSEESNTVTVHTSTKKVATKKVKVVPKLKSATLKQLSEQAAKNTSERKLHVFYEPDDESLLPVLHKKQTLPPKTIKIEPVGAKKISITQAESNATFKADEIPTVSLSGDLTVTDYPATQSAKESRETPLSPTTPKENKQHLDRKNKKNKDISSKRTFAERLKKQNLKPVSESARPKQPQVADDPKNRVLSGHKESQNDSLSKLETSPKKGEGTAVQKLAPTEVVTSFTPHSVQKQTKKVPKAILLSPLIASIIAVIVTILIFSANTTVVVSDSKYESQVVFQKANLQEIFSQK